MSTPPQDSKSLLSFWDAIKELFKSPISLSILAVFIILASILAIQIDWKGKPIFFIRIKNSFCQQDKKGELYIRENQKNVAFLSSVISTEVFTLDALQFTSSEIRQLIKIRNKHIGKPSHDEINNLISDSKAGFNTYERIKKKFLVNYGDEQFYRVQRLLLKPKCIDEHLSIDERKEIFLGEYFWDLVDKGCKLYCFPKQEQYSICCISIKNVTKECILKTGSISLDGNIKSCAGLNVEEEIKIKPSKQNVISLCMFQGEQLEIYLDDQKVVLTLESISNELENRGNRDIVYFSWSRE